MPNRILVSRASLAHGSRKFSLRVLTALARVGYLHLELPTAKVRGTAVLTCGCSPGRLDSLVVSRVRGGIDSIHAACLLRLTLNGGANALVFARGLPRGLLVGALVAGPAIAVSAAWLTHSQSSIAAANVFGAHQHESVVRELPVAEGKPMHREGDASSGLVITDCFRIITGLIGPRAHTTLPGVRITVTMGIRN